MKRADGLGKVRRIQGTSLAISRPTMTTHLHLPLITAVVVVVWLPVYHTK